MTSHLSYPYLTFDCIPSTNRVARQLLESGQLSGPAVIRAREQSAGRGRGERSWLSPRGGLWMTRVLRPKVPRNRWSLYALVAGGAAAQAVEDLWDLQVDLKWPNDLLWQGRKLGGVLCEGVGDNLLVGIGINGAFTWKEWPSDLAGGFIPVDLREATGGRFDATEEQLDALLRGVTASIDSWEQLLQVSTDHLIAQWKDRSNTLNQEVIITEGASAWCGRAVDVDGEGRIVVQLPSGERKSFASGDVRLRSQPTEGRGENS